MGRRQRRFPTRPADRAERGALEGCWLAMLVARARVLLDCPRGASELER